jgi:SAM-dependent methyltransferase
MATALHPVRGRLNAGFLRLVDGYVHHVLGERKHALFATLPDTVVEIGPGTGANMRYYRPGTRIVAIEPNVHMHGGLRRAAERHGAVLDVRAAGAEATGLPDASVDAVVATLVLCTVPDPSAALAEARRILRPGGRLVLVEHVAAAPGSALGGLQRVLAPAWRWAFEGCDLQRDTAAAVHAAGFAEVSLQRYRARSAFLPLDVQIAGTAIR